MLLTLALIYITRSPWGRVLRAIREDEDAARALGKNALAYKLQSLAIAAAIGAFAGMIYAIDLATIHPLDFQPLFTFFAYAVLILGGLASYWGVIFGGDHPVVAARGVALCRPRALRAAGAALRFGLIGLILILLMAFRPQGPVRQARGDGAR